MLRTPQLKPYIVYIKPPPFEELKESRQAAHARSTFDETSSRGFTVIILIMSTFGGRTKNYLGLFLTTYRIVGLILGTWENSESQENILGSREKILNAGEKF